MDQTFNLFDIALFLVTFLIAFSGFIKGFIKGVVSVLIWIIAIVVTYFASPYVAQFLSNYSDSSLITYAASRLFLFIFVFFLLSIAVSESVKDLRKKIPSSFDRSFGFLFGIFKSILIFSIFYSAIYKSFAFISDKTGVEKEVPTWIKNAKTSSILKITSTYVDPAVETFIQSVTDNFYKSALDKKGLDNKIDEISDQDNDRVNELQEVQRKIKRRRESNKKPKTYEDEIFDYGYSKKDIEKMKRLIEIVE